MTDTRAKCAACARGPVGAEGHLDLFVSRMSGKTMQFYCRVCDTLWTRTSDSSFGWAEASAGLEAPTVPGGPLDPPRGR